MTNETDDSTYEKESKRRTTPSLIPGFYTVMAT